MNPTTQKQPSTNTPAHSFIVTCVIGLLVFGALFGALEAAFRLNLFANFLPVRSVGSYHAQFEQKLFKLEDYVNKYGGVDVIVIGNSMVNTGIIPGTAANRYAELTGDQLRIFNFGVEGLTVSSVAILCNYLVENYHPGTLLVYTEMRDYIANNGDDVAQEFLNNAWMQYQIGHWSLQGFIVDHSQALQHLLAFRNWSRYDFLTSYNTAYHRQDATWETGYEEDAKKPKIESIIRKPDPANPQDAPIFAELKNYKMAPEKIEALKEILSLQEKGVRVLFSEIPVYPTYYGYFDDDNARPAYLTEINETISAAGSYFIPTINQMRIPLNGRSDNHHLNRIGAPIYSQYLGSQLGDLCNEQQICLQPSSGATLP